MSGEHDPRRWWTLGVLCLSLVLVVVGNTVLNVALPTLVRKLGATSSELQWMVDSYALVFAGLLLTAGALGDRFGRKGALTLGLLVFGTASLASTIAESADHIVITRAVMGLGAAFVMPATLSILTSVFPPQERARAIAIWAGFAGAGGAIGPVAGGWLLERFYWGSVFFLNVPIVLVAIAAGRWLVPTSRNDSHVPIDLLGAGLSTAGIGAVLYGIIEAPSRGWLDGRVAAAFVLGLVIITAFVAWQRRAAEPMLDVRLFRQRRFTLASIAISLVFFVMFGTFFLLTQYLQIVRDYSPLEAGIRLLPTALTLLVVAPRSARLVDRFGPRDVITTGLTLVGLAMLLASTFDADTGYPWLVVVLVIGASGMGISMAPATTTIMASLPLRKAGVGSAWNDATRELGGALGVAVLGSILSATYTTSLMPHTDRLPEKLSTAAHSSVGAAVEISGRLPAPAGEALAAAARSAYVEGMEIALAVAAAVAFVGALAARGFPVVTSAVQGAETSSVNRFSDRMSA